MSTLNVDKVDPNTGTDLEIGTSGDTITVPTGAGLTVTDEVKTNKISPATGTAFALGDSGDTFTVPSGATIVNSGTATGFGITSSSFLPIATPLWYNGDMQVAQRATSATGKTASGYYACDRMHLNLYNLGTWTIAQETLTSGNAYADGFQKAFRIDCTTADASPAASDHGFFRQKFEGQDVQVFKKGTANAETYTLAFWVKSNKTGTDIFTCGLYDHDNSRSVFQNYTISSADTWEYKVLNFPKDTTGVMDSNNAVSIDVRWYLGAGSNFTGGTQATTAWEAQTNANNLPSGKVNIADSTSNDIAITGVQLEVGTYTSADLPPFRHESFGDNLRRCLRYAYQAIQGTGEELSGGWYYSTSHISWMMVFPVPMRVKPTCTASDAADMWVIYRAAGADTFESIHLENTDNLFDKVSMYNSTDVSGTAGDAGIVRSYDASSSAFFDAEL